MSAQSSAPRRVLVVDDNASIHEDFHRILIRTADTSDLDAEAAELFGMSTASPSSEAHADFDLECALQGQEALEKVRNAKAAGRPFALAFVDMRMPPGWDGLTTIQKLWEVDAQLHIVICTAHSDRTWDEIAAALTARDRWVALKKPFDKIEVLQLAHVLTTKWLGAQAEISRNAARVA